MKSTNTNQSNNQSKEYNKQTKENNQPRSTKAEIKQIDKEVLTYLKRKCNNVKRNIPKEVRLLFISNKTHYSYQQVRDSVDRLVKLGILEKWTVWCSPMKRKSYYRISQKAVIS